MGRQAYRNRLALGRSPYEPPERPSASTVDVSAPVQRRTSALHADGYLQHYDERGHPVNTESKAFGRELRKAKNDILSTMGIVVSEDGNAGAPTEQQKIDMIVTENDYGLLMATFDQVAVFLGSWWTSSLTGRIQTFKSYTHVPLMNIIGHERSSIGIIGFYFAGIPAWAVSTGLSICRHHPLERLVTSFQSRFPNDDPWSRIVRSSFTIFHSAARGTLLVLAVQTYMYSLLQSLHLIHPYSMPGIQFLIPIGELASMHVPSLPSELSFNSISGFFLNLLKTPSLLVYLYVYLRPMLEIKIYRLIRRRLPKPSLADELSIRVAFENDLIDWMVPTLGRRSEEENHRSNLSLAEDVMYEITSLRDWVLSWLRFKQRRGSRGERAASIPCREERIESLRHNLEELQNELGAAQSRTRFLQRRPEQFPVPPEEQALREHSEAMRSTSPGLNASTQVPNPEPDFNDNRILSNEENRISQSPVEMTGDYFSELRPLGQTGEIPSTTDLSRPLGNIEAHRGDEINPLNSRSNTLFSRPSSPATSPPPSPRVRASLIHQSSDVITMQLELLGSSASNNNQLNPRSDNENNQRNSNGEPADRRSIADFLETLLSNQGHNLTTTANSDAMDSDALSNMTRGVSPGVGDGASASASVFQDQEQNAVLGRSTPDSPAVVPASRVANILPDSVEELSADEAHNPAPEAEASVDNDSDAELPPSISGARPPQDSKANTSSTAHRVTILSCHPVDSLASHISSLVTTVLFIPLESFYLRSLASAYLASVGSSASLCSDVRPLGAWGGGGSRSDILAYMGKLALMMGVQAAVNASVWGIVSGTAIKMGRRFCGWGTL